MRWGPLLLDVSGCELSQVERELFAHPAVGGTIIFARNYSSQQQLQALLNDINSIRPQIPIFIDQEGGRVQRLQGDFPDLMPMPDYASEFKKLQADKDQLQLLNNKIAHVMQALAKLGITVNLSPVLDLDYELCPALDGRCLGKNAEDVIAAATNLITIMHGSGLRVCGKHFPGHGAVTIDSHLDLPIDLREQELIFSQDIRPFATLSSSLDCIMPGHVLYPAVDPDYPASLSKIWLQDVLRQQLGFKRAIISDDLHMLALEKYGDIQQRLALSLAAGCDYLCVCNNQAGSIAAIDFLGSNLAAKLLSGPDGGAWQRRAYFVGAISK